MSTQLNDQSAKGIVQSATDEYMDVRLTTPADLLVHSKGLGVTKGNQKVIRLQNKYHFHEGDAVVVHVYESPSSSELLLSYFTPFLLATTTLAILIQNGVGKGLAGILSLSILIPYLLLIRLNRSHIAHERKLEVEPG